MTGFIPAPVKPEITMDHLEKVDIRTGLIKRVELVPTSNKLVRLTVDFDDRRRTVLAGLRRERADLNRAGVANLLFVIVPKVPHARRSPYHKLHGYRATPFATRNSRWPWTQVWTQTRRHA